MSHDLLSEFGFVYDGTGAEGAPAADAEAPAPAPAPPPAAALPVLLQGGPMSARAQALATIRHHLRQALLSWRMARKRDGGLIHGVEHWQPPSVAGQLAYRDGRGWVPPGHEGGWAERWGEAYHTWFAVPVMIPLILCLWVVARPFRFFAALPLIALAVTAAVVVLAHYGVL